MIFPGLGAAHAAKNGKSRLPPCLGLAFGALVADLARRLRGWLDLFLVQPPGHGLGLALRVQGVFLGVLDRHSGLVPPDE